MPDDLKAGPSPLRVDGTAIEWTESPCAGIWRRRLDHHGPAESGRVTSLVRFEPGARFDRHDHPDGEEFFVLSGSFTDDYGTYGPGTFVYHPEGVAHTPLSHDGCEIFVKLRQAPGKGRSSVVCDSTALDWQDTGRPGLRRKPLMVREGWPEQVYLYRFDAGAVVPLHDHARTEEVFVIEGAIRDEHGACAAGTWARYPAGSSHAVRSESGALLLVRFSD